jgi:hypothetical protein
MPRAVDAWPVYAPRTLFLGGPADGQWLHVPLDALAWDVSASRYRREGLQCARQDFRYFVWEGLSSAAALECLLRGYQRPAWSASEAPLGLLVWLLSDDRDDDGSVLGVFVTPQLAWAWLTEIERPGCAVAIEWTVDEDGDYVGQCAGRDCYSLTAYELESTASFETDLGNARALLNQLQRRRQTQED